MRTLHSHRCETCYKDDCIITYYDIDKYKSIKIDPKDLMEESTEFVQGIKQVGCASYLEQGVASHIFPYNQKEDVQPNNQISYNLLSNTIKTLWTRQQVISELTEGVSNT